MQSIKVAIYEDNVGLREVLAEVIRSHEGFELAGEFGHCLDVVKNTKVFGPDVILMDIDMPGKSGIDGVKDVKSVHPEVEIIINTVFDDDDRVFKALQAGATGYLLKKNSINTLLRSIREVKEGGAPMSPTIARRVLSNTVEGKANENVYHLSEKEYEIITLLAKGCSYKMVAEKAFISIDTVRTYVKRIYEKLHVHSVTEAVHKVFIQK